MSDTAVTDLPGQSIRARVPRSAHADVTAHDRDPIAILAAQNQGRMPELVPVRIGRMLQSPFAYYRGSAGSMAADLSHDPTTDLRVVSCGDAHVSNFGFFASPERALLFDLNDFDEAGIAPFDWDLKRLVASVHVGGRDLGLSESQCADAVLETATAYREQLRELSRRSALARYFDRMDDTNLEAMITRKQDRKVIRKAATKARRRTSERVLSRITTTDSEGGLRIVEQPPIMMHVEQVGTEEMRRLYREYQVTVREDVALLLDQVEPIDVVLRVVGVGSVGTRCFVVALQGGSGDVIFLQVKEALPSVLVTYGQMPQRVPGMPARVRYTEGHRVVAAQRILQSQSDPFLGWIRAWAGTTTGRRTAHYYFRQFRDMKGSVDLTGLDGGQFARYGRLCALLLARAHSQSPAVGTIAAYLGRSTATEDALVRWAARYADRVEADYEALTAAVRAGILPAEHGV